MQVHWGTFLLTGEHILEPPQRLAKAVTEAGLEPGAFVCLGHGETRVFDLVRRGAAAAGPRATVSVV